MGSVMSARCVVIVNGSPKMPVVPGLMKKTQTTGTGEETK
jgi:hypothetical protein